MAHFAKLDENNVVLAVHVVTNETITLNGIESEQVGIDFLENLYDYSNWKQTSYNGTIRKNFAGIDFTYDPVRDAFIPPKRFNSWTLNEDTCQWEAPVARPTDDKAYRWDEATVSWVEIEVAP